MVEKKVKLPVSKIIGENYDDGTPVDPMASALPTLVDDNTKEIATVSELDVPIAPSDGPAVEDLNEKYGLDEEPKPYPFTPEEIEAEAIRDAEERASIKEGIESGELCCEDPENCPEPWEVEDMLLVCSQCGHVVRVPPMEKVPEMCRCGLKYDHEHELTPTAILIREPTTLIVRKMAREW